MLFNRWFIELINKSDQLKTMVVRNRSKAETTERTTIPEFGMHFMFYAMSNAVAQQKIERDAHIPM